MSIKNRFETGPYYRKWSLPAIIKPTRPKEIFGRKSTWLTPVSHVEMWILDP